MGSRRNSFETDNHEGQHFEPPPYTRYPTAACPEERTTNRRPEVRNRNRPQTEAIDHHLVQEYCYRYELNMRQRIKDGPCALSEPDFELWHRTTSQKVVEDFQDEKGSNDVGRRELKQRMENAYQKMKEENFEKPTVQSVAGGVAAGAVAGAGVAAGGAVGAAALGCALAVSATVATGGLVVVGVAAVGVGIGVGVGVRKLVNFMQKKKRQQRKEKAVNAL